MKTWVVAFKVEMVVEAETELEAREVGLELAHECRGEFEFFDNDITSVTVKEETNGAS